MNLKIGYVVDSSIGYTKKESEKRGLYFLPLIININGKDHLDGIDINADEYYNQIKLSDEIRTSATSPGIVKKVLKKASKENDLVIVYPISKELSSQYGNIKMIANNFKNVKVIKSKSLGIMTEKEINNIKEFAKTAQNMEEIIDFANNSSNNISGLLIPRTLDWLVKGGRISASIAQMANLLKIIPIIRFKNGELKKEGKGRVFRKTCIKSFKKILHESIDKKIYILIGNGKEEKNVFDEISKHNDVSLHKIPPVIATHCGPNSFIVVSKLK